jgi:hypothetical protein
MLDPMAVRRRLVAIFAADAEPKCVEAEPLSSPAATEDFREWPAVYLVAG